MGSWKRSSSPFGGMRALRPRQSSIPCPGTGRVAAGRREWGSGQESHPPRRRSARPAWRSCRRRTPPGAPGATPQSARGASASAAPPAGRTSPRTRPGRRQQSDQKRETEPPLSKQRAQSTFTHCYPIDLDFYQYKKTCLSISPHTACIKEKCNAPTTS